jgi:hypothetical protein
MIRSRFLRLWVLWSLLYLVFAVAGPNGLVPAPVWPVISQHVLQARAWLGSDIGAPNPDGGPDRMVAVSPRLDVTPYFETRVVRDPREDSIAANLAVAARTPEGELVPAQEVWGGSAAGRPGELICQVGFPLGPALLLLPLYALLGGALATQWLGAILGGLAVAIMDRLMTDWTAVMGVGEGFPGANALAVLAGAGTLWLWIVPYGDTFLFAQVVGTTALAAALLLGWRQHPWAAGLVFGLAFTSRPAMLGLREIVARSAPVLMAALPFGIVTLVLNYLRFGSAREFGYSFMILPSFLRMRLLEHGQLSWAYLARNLHVVGIQPPQLVHDQAGALVFPFLASDPQGMGIFFVTPAFIALAAALWVTGRHRGALLAAAWVSLALVSLPGLFYYNTGWVQWGGRFLVDAWPMWLLLAALGLRRVPRGAAMFLIVVSVISNLWAALLVVMRVWPGCGM